MGPVSNIGECQQKTKAINVCVFFIEYERLFQFAPSSVFRDIVYRHFNKIDAISRGQYSGVSMPVTRNTELGTLNYAIDASVCVGAASDSW